MGRVACGLLSALMATGLLAAPARAQSPTDAARRDQFERRRAAERERQPRGALQRGADVFGGADAAPPRRDWPAPETPCFTIERVELRGQAVDSFAWVTDALTRGPDPAVGRCLGAQGVSVAVARAQQHLAAQGFVTSLLVLETQDLAPVKRGTGAFWSLPAPEEAFDEGRSRFKLFSLEAAWSQPVDLWGARLHLGSQWRGQRERTPLTPQDRFAMGGRYSVRGFDGESSLIGERGWLWRNELSLLLGDSGQQLYLGVDQGRVGGASAQWLVGQRLAGAVLGLRGAWGPAQYDEFLGVPVHKPEGFRTAKVSAGFQLSASF